jgi:uncharacterized protein YdeI (YjbR/CyaY-like superfamily)
MKQLYCKTRQEWRNWLKRNHHKEQGIWLVFYKKDTGKPTIDYRDALDEALCFGWIDSIIKKIDATKYERKFTPRNKISNWSDINKKRVEQLIKEHKMTDSGYAIIKIAKANGCWDKSDRPPLPTQMPKEFQVALNRNRTALNHFNRLAPGFQKRYQLWIATAKRPETKDKRIREAILLLEQGQKLGLK